MPLSIQEPGRQLARAEQAWLDGRHDEAEQHFEAAIDGAHELGLVSVEGAALAAASRFYFETARPIVGADLRARAVEHAGRADEAAAITAANRSLHAALRGSNIGVWELDYRDPQVRPPPFLQINFWESLGWNAPEEVKIDGLTRMRPERFHSEDRDRMYEQMAVHMRGETDELYVDQRMYTPDGSIRHTVVRARCTRDDAGTPQRLVGTMVDITERRLLEDQTRAATAVAERANRSKDEFLANVSHEIRTPMNAILGMTELTLDTPLTSEQRHWITTVKAAADNLLVIIDELLDFSKAAANKLELSVAEFALHDQLAETVHGMRLAARAKGLALTLDLGHDVPNLVRGDITRLRQILTNFVGNAIKFTDAGMVELIVRRAGNAISFAVRDTGIGIDQDKLGTIFEPFRTREVRGTGLGLPIAMRLAALMNGRIDVESERGRGSTFTLTVELEAASPPDRVVFARPLRVLVAEDSEFNADLIRELLKRRGYEPHIVDNGHAVLAAIAQSEYDILLLDLHMPGLDGFQVIAQIRARETSGHLPVVALTARSQAEVRAQCLAAGMDDFLGKPIRSTALWETIERLARRR